LVVYQHLKNDGKHGVLSASEQSCLAAADSKSPLVGDQEWELRPCKGRSENVNNANHFHHAGQSFPVLWKQQQFLKKRNVVQEKCISSAGVLDSASLCWDVAVAIRKAKQLLQLEQASLECIPRQQRRAAQKANCCIGTRISTSCAPVSI
jgi:hypothetical protein